MLNIIRVTQIFQLFIAFIVKKLHTKQFERYYGQITTHNEV